MIKFIVIESPIPLKRNTWAHPYDVYKIKKGELVYVWSSHYHFWTCIRTHAVNFLIDHKKISEKFRPDNTYYDDKTYHHVRIDVIMLDKHPMKKFEPFTV